MALDPRKRQKKLEKRHAKQKAKKKTFVREHSLGLAQRLERSATAPILHCCVNDDMWDNGLGNILISRQLPDGTVAYGAFLVDLYYLGVKDAFSGVVTREEYDWGIYEKLKDKRQIEHLQPSYARKLIEGAVQFARENGVAPHPEYQRTKLILGDIDASLCEEEFEFGRDGEALFIPGPYDSVEIEELIDDDVPSDRDLKLALRAAIEDLERAEDDDTIEVAASPPEDEPRRPGLIARLLGHRGS